LSRPNFPLPIRSTSLSTSLCSAALLLLSLSLLLIPAASAQKWNRYGPGTRTQASVIYDASTDQMIMYGGQHAPNLVDFHDTWTIKNVIASSRSSFDNLDWIALTTTGVPKSRFGQSAIYNPTSNRMVIYGGGEGFPGPCVSELWLLTNPNSVGTPVWSQMTATGTLPPVREGHVAVYNSTANTMTVFGGTDCNGNYYNDVWILSNADGSTGTPSWAQAKPLGTPPSARAQHTAIYDPVKNVMTVFGGLAANKALFNDVWTLSNANGRTGTPTWAKLSPSGTAPSARSGHVAVYDSANNRMIIHGGGQVNSTAIDSDTWALTDANGTAGNPAWTLLTPTDTPPARRSHSAIYDPGSNEMVIFGGTSTLPQTFTDDHVFVLTNANGLESGATWSQYGPAPRVHTSSGYDAVTDQLIVFGGQPQDSTAGLNDVWAEVGVASSGQDSQPTTNWLQVFPSGTAPSPRFGHTGLYDSNSNRMMIFGGATSATSCLNDVWILDDANSAHGTPDWLSIPASGTPPAPRMNQTAQYDPTKNVLMVFGGTNCNSGYFQDVWVLTNANGEGGTPTWTKLATAGTPPPARENSSSIFDSVHNVLLVYAGDAGGAGFSDLWALSNANGQSGTAHWRQFAPTGTPPEGRTGQITVYDSANNRMIMYGGINAINGTRFLYDSWILTNANSLGGTPAWTAEVVSGTAPQRFFHTGFYSPTLNFLIVFGGDSQIEALPDDHIFVLSQANGLP
jgi:Galactose oxidase, central domain